MLTSLSHAALTLTLLALRSADPFPYPLSEAERSRDAHAHELRAHVYRLASKEFLGRGGPGAARASRHVAAAFKALDLKPAFGDSYYQNIPHPPADGVKKAGFAGRNVAAIIPGGDPKLKGEWVVLSAHFDHLGVKDGVLYPGADDNASGVAALLEIAEWFALGKEKPRRTLVLVSFDREETGLLGSKHFAAKPPLPLPQLKAFLTADMLGRSMAGVMDEYVFALGGETAAHFRKVLDEVAPAKGVKVGRVGADLIGTRSDYGPFRDLKVPFLFFSTGPHPDYHRPTDTPDRIDYARLEKITRWVAAVTWRLANDDAVPVWEGKPAPSLAEAAVVRELLTRILNHPDAGLTKGQRELLTGVNKRLGGMVERGKVTEEEREWLVQIARLLMGSLFS
jgi:hypothetical protein